MDAAHHSPHDNSPPDHLPVPTDPVPSPAAQAPLHHRLPLPVPGVRGGVSELSLLPAQHSLLLPDTGRLECIPRTGYAGDCSSVHWSVYRVSGSLCSVLPVHCMGTVEEYKGPSCCTAQETRVEVQSENPHH